MIKLNRGECPKELTDEVKEELTELYKKDKEKDVWNSPKIKKTLKEALLEMSHGKCSYCECALGIESKDVTIDCNQRPGSDEEIQAEISVARNGCFLTNF